jgi:septal ring factor EnvC (AmiA/AmiB activator)
MVDFARSLARRGLREDALLILDLLPSEETNETLDLRARILTQLGRYAEAEDTWQKVIAACPDHQGATAGLAAVANLRKKPLARFRVACALRFKSVASVCIVLLLVALAMTSAGLLWHRLHTLGKGQETLLAQRETRNEEVDKQLAAVRQDAADLTNLQLNLRDSLKEVKTAVESLQDNMTKADAATRKQLVTKVSQAAAALKKDITDGDAQTRGQVAKVKAAQDALAKALGEQTGTFAKEQKAVAASLAKLTEVSGSSGESLGKSLAALKKDLDALKQSLAAASEADGKQTAALAETKALLAGKLATLDKQLGTLLAADPSKKISELSAQYLQLRASLSAQKKQTDSLIAQIKGLSEEAATLGKAVDALASKPAPTPSAPATPAQ